MSTFPGARVPPCPRVCGFGTSITRGQGSADLTSWRPGVWSRARAAGRSIVFRGPNTDGTTATGLMNGGQHAGVGGNTIPQITARVTEAIVRATDIFTLEGGANEALTGNIATVQADYTALINAVRAFSATVPILCLMPTVQTDAVGGPLIPTVIASELAAVTAIQGGGDTRLVWVPTTNFTTADLADVVHPSQAGFDGPLSDDVWNAIIPWIV